MKKMIAVVQKHPRLETGIEVLLKRADDGIVVDSEVFFKETQGKSIDAAMKYVDSAFIDKDFHILEIKRYV